jgi:hypothetical protein
VHFVPAIILFAAGGNAAMVQSFKLRGALGPWPGSAETKDGCTNLTMQSEIFGNGR